MEDITNINGKSIIITGGTTGIGRATALYLAQKGANILIAGKDQEHLNQTLSDAQQANLQGSFNGIIADMTNEEGIQILFEEADRVFNNKLDIMINNAAVAFQSITEGSYADWEAVTHTNLLAYMACARQAIDRMRGHQEGHIVNIGSMSADVREKDSSVYVATKSGIQGFSEALRKEVNELGIKVTLIEPGAVDTDMQPASTDEKQESVEKMEMLEADDIAAAIYYAICQPKRCDVVDIKIRPHMQLI
jgi:NADP-dependent 3-hydroxy acid dehydrogenase YdfG